ncbi:CRISPR-associated protein Csx16 [Arhodomonas sp. AD133]|uniref:CRISPR-associated protein Csx16 n=1 Tax=Arhodomonas sp. AD133 TaxID=3415009 RepID=UPI003EBB9136
MTTWIVSRHPGAIEWLRRRGYRDAHHLAHLQWRRVAPGDVVIGNLPISLVAELGRRGIAYYHLTVPLPHERRGRELSADELEQLGACLQRYQATKPRD